VPPILDILVVIFLKKVTSPNMLQRKGCLIGLLDKTEECLHEKDPSSGIQETAHKILALLIK
jgi:hypothetical protein